LGAEIYGIIGMFLAIPTMAIIRVVVTKLIEKYEINEMLE